MDNMTKKLIHDTKFDAQYAAEYVRKLADSKFATSRLSNNEQENLQKCAVFLARLNDRFDKMYNDNKAWEA